MMPQLSAVWEETTLGAAVDLFDHRRIPLSTRERSQRRGRFPYYGASGVIDHINDYIFDGRYLLVSEDGANLVTRRTPIAFIAKGKFWVNNHAHVVRGREGVADDHFLLCYLAQADISGFITGTAQPKLTQANLKAIRLRLPPLAMQRRIASILSAYDDLVENNTRRIAILEEMAQAIYREWFVNFRFPGHEGVDLVESDVGLIPNGWKVLPLGTVVETVGGGTPRTDVEEYWADGEITWFSPRDLTARGAMFITRSGKYITEGGLKSSSARLFPRHCVMMTSRATVGVVAINSVDACTNQGFITCIPNRAASVYQLYFWIKDSLGVINNLATGTTFKEINKTAFRSIPIIVADETTTERFQRVVSPLGQQIEVLLRQSEVLRETRDLLLPKLVSGEIEVSQFTDELEEAIA